jgi:choline dehydrogenase-like flavoprotein
MLSDATTLDPEATKRARILIVGAGAVGLTMAIDLVRRGLAVTVLEAGTQAVSGESQRYFEAAKALGRPLEGRHLGRFRALGGSTNFWGGQLARFDPIVFEPRAWIGAEAGWPISRSDLERYYDRALDLLGMTGARESDAEIMARLGLVPPPLPEALSFFLTRWVPEPNFAVLFRHEIETLPLLRVVTGAPVVALTRDPAGATVDGVVVLDSGGRRLRLHADRIILANGTIEIARLLSLPFADGAPPPWGDNPWLGRGFMDHVAVIGGDLRPLDRRRFHDLFDNAVLDRIKYQPKLKLSEAAQRERQLCGVSAHLIFNSALAEDLANAKIFAKAFLRGRIDGTIGDLPKRFKTLLTVGLPMIARYLRHRRIYNPADRGVQLRLNAEQYCLPESRLILQPERDDLGMPLVGLDWRIDGSELETIASFAESVRDYLAATGLADLTLDPRLVARDPAMLDLAVDDYHHMGMARMADRPEHGVVDADLSVFGARNISVAGAAVYPSTGCMNPTFTAIALGLRLAERLAGQMR